MFSYYTFLHCSSLFGVRTSSPDFSVITTLSSTCSWPTIIFGYFFVSKTYDVTHHENCLSEMIMITTLCFYCGFTKTGHYYHQGYIYCSLLPRPLTILIFRVITVHANTCVWWPILSNVPGSNSRCWIRSDIHLPSSLGTTSLLPNLYVPNVPISHN